MVRFKGQEKGSEGAKAFLEEDESGENYSDEEEHDRDNNETLGAFGVTASVAYPQSTVENVQSQAEVFFKAVSKTDSQVSFGIMELQMSEEKLWL